MPALTRKTLTATLKDIDIVETSKVDDVTITSDKDTLTIGSVCLPKLRGEKELVPDTLFYENKNVSKFVLSLLYSISSVSISVKERTPKHILNCYLLNIGVAKIIICTTPTFATCQPTCYLPAYFTSYLFPDLTE